MNVNEIIKKDCDHINQVFDAITEEINFVEKARETLHEQSEYYPDIMPIVNHDILDNVWYDRKDSGDPPRSVTSADIPYIIIVRYFETYGPNIKLRSKIAVDIGYWLGLGYWCVENDWDECGMGVEVLAYKRCDSSIPDRYLRMPSIDVLKDGSVGFKRA